MDTFTYQIDFDDNVPVNKDGGGTGSGSGCVIL